MSKLVKEPIEKCGECPHKTKRVDYDESTYDTAIVCPKQGYKVINSNTIDKDCPLPDVEVQKSNELMESENGGQPFKFFTEDNIKIEDIDAIYIVKRKKAI